MANDKVTYNWAYNEFKDANFGDERLTQRLIKRNCSPL